MLSRLQNESLWLGREIPMHAEDIHRLTGLSTEGRDVSTTFQTVSKRAKKAGDCNYYKKYTPKEGGRGRR